jgi:hypothetical protein
LFRPNASRIEDVVFKVKMRIAGKSAKRELASMAGKKLVLEGFVEK